MTFAVAATLAATVVACDLLPSPDVEAETDADLQTRETDVRSSPPSDGHDDPQPQERRGPQLEQLGTDGIRLTRVAQLEAAIAGAVGPNGDLFLADRRGTVHRLDPDEDDGVTPPLLDIRDETSVSSERGLLGMAFAADGTEVYLSYTDTQGDTRVDAFAVVDGEIDPDVRRAVFAHPQPFANHNGGDIRIGPDGLLYIGLGDGGGGGDPLGAGQDRGSMLGAILRIDPQAGPPYGVPLDNPFVGEDVAIEIYVYGVRNPWRFTFDEPTSTMWVADVGQNAREEVTVVHLDDDAGANLGWNLMEGTVEFAGTAPDDHLPPVFEYETTSSRCAITGGHVYRGSRIELLYGAYVFSDYCDGRVRALAVQDNDVVDELAFSADGGPVVAFTQDAGGELYALALDGAVYRLDPA